MKKNIENLISFYLKNKSELSEIFSLTTNTIKIKSKKDNTSIKLEGYPDNSINFIFLENDNQITHKFFKKEELNNVLNEIFNLFEENDQENKYFITKYGRETFETYKDIYLSALTGNKEKDEFIFEKKETDEGEHIKIEILITNKITGITDAGSIEIKKETPHFKYTPCLTTYFSASAITPNADSGFLSNHINFVFSQEDLKKYNLIHETDDELINTEEKLIDYIYDKTTSKHAKKIFQVFELSTTLSEINKNPKKQKI